MGKRLTSVIIANSNKVLREFNQTNLLEIKIAQLKRCSSVENIFIVSNDEDVLLKANDLNIKTIKTNCDNEKLSKEMCEKIEDENILFVNCAYPFVKDETIEEAIECYFENVNEYDSLNSSHLVKKYLWQDNKPLNFSQDEFLAQNDLPNIMALNFAFDIVKKEILANFETKVSKKAYLFELKKEETINAMIDFEYAEFAYKK